MSVSLCPIELAEVRNWHITGGDIQLRLALNHTVFQMLFWRGIRLKQFTKESDGDSVEDSRNTFVFHTFHAIAHIGFAYIKPKMPPCSLRLNTRLDM